ncbi:hypothetical protein BCV69DRAFT_284054 [Microstroma glucosiphilum]|uniref:Uncharacterized protein n=1 Tax=Pseudomicrostroma glucosiphilum TaxID=1684307 RepID=A0A316U4M2_9BASI|nr:hypothetical protein BCV69DRAFT_284054 [Pseudomicrostroma glucosiphilum]PWN19421.1 hypothetical protein BCV69DRAFT_284054 [Pseudomicrostroma glucosiphilum]
MASFPPVEPSAEATPRSSLTQRQLKSSLNPSVDDSAPGQQAKASAFSPVFTKRKSSIDWSKAAPGKGSSAVGGTGKAHTEDSKAPVRSSAVPLRPQVTKKEAIAIRHAKVLEQMLSAPSQNCACLIVKKQNKGGTGDAITRKQAVSLKKALLDRKAAPRIISKVRALDGASSVGFLPATSESAAERALVSVQKVDALPDNSEASKGTSDLLVRARRLLVKRLSINAAEEKEAQALSAASPLASPTPHGKCPLKAVCLDRTDEEAALMPSHSLEKASSTKADSTDAGTSDALPTFGISVISLASTAVLGRLGEASGALLEQTAVNDDIHPPLDRMAIFVFWWGFEVTLPTPTMQYLQTAHNVSGSVLNVLSMMVTAGGLFELLPYIRYISMTVDVEFRAIQAVDQGNGVVLAATVSCICRDGLANKHEAFADVILTLCMWSTVVDAVSARSTSMGPLSGGTKRSPA